MKVIKTPWGSVTPKVDLFPIYYLIFIYGFMYILPYGKSLVGISWFDFLRSEDGPLEWIQFFQYLFASIISFIIFIKSRNKRSFGVLIWLVFGLACFIVAGEEISWTERITGFSLNSISEANVQGETNFHNLPFFHHNLLDLTFIMSSLFLGWIGWRKWPNFKSLPGKELSLYFLFVALFYFYFDISWISTISQIRNDQEIFEILFSSGLLLHCVEYYKRIRKKNILN
tara:strand:- start:215 stop:898 length:684 start_codon:yes stop_codon:yes gene_type:complete